jgi:tRNA-dihydrouridine synthase B
MREPDLATQRDLLLEHYDAMLVHFGRDAGLRLARKHVAWYSRGLPGSAEFRAEVMKRVEVAQVIALIDRFYTPLIEGGFVRAPVALDDSSGPEAAMAAALAA